MRRNEAEQVIGKHEESTAIHTLHGRKTKEMQTRDQKNAYRIPKSATQTNIRLRVRR